jgi:uncharacterized surface protein with fasciclin (FAS1) repeats
MSDLSILSELLVLADFNGVLNSSGILTLAAPTNSAFEALGDAFLESLRDPFNQNSLIRILEYHVIFGVLSLDELALQTAFFTFAGIVVETSVDDQTIQFNQATAIDLDILLASNGAMYKIDAVLNPDDPANGF